MAELAAHYRFRQPLSAIVALADTRAAEPDPHAARRADKRHRYLRTGLQLDVVDRQHNVRRYDAVPRDLSAGGVTLLVPAMVYPDQACRQRLVTLHQSWHWVVGRIRRCAYLPGTAGIHEIGIQFSQPIDMSRFDRAARVIQMAMLSADPSLAPLLVKLSADLPLKIAATDAPDELVAIASNSTHALMMLDLDGLDDIDTIMRRVRSGGFLRPALALSHDPQRPGTRFDGVLIKPVNSTDLTNALHAVLDEPIVSSLGDEPELAELIDDFVGKLPEAVQAIAMAHWAGDAETVRTRLQTLAGQAGSFGFEVITEHARRACDALHAGSADREINYLIRSCLAAQRVNCQPAPGS